MDRRLFIMGLIQSCIRSFAGDDSVHGDVSSHLHQNKIEENLQLWVSSGAETERSSREAIQRDILNYSPASHYLRLTESSLVSTLPESINWLEGLEVLVVKNFHSLESLPDLTGVSGTLRELDLTGSENLKALPDLQDFKNLEQLLLCRCEALTNITDDASNLSNIKVLDLRFCSGIEELPQPFGALKVLDILELQGAGLTVLPVDIGECEKLRHLNIRSCPLSEIPDSLSKAYRLEYIDARNCDSLEILPADIGGMRGLKRLIIFDSPKVRLPDSSFGLEQAHIEAGLKYSDKPLHESIYSLKERIDQAKSLGNDNVGVRLSIFSQKELRC